MFNCQNIVTWCFSGGDVFFFYIFKNVQIFSSSPPGKSFLALIFLNNVGILYNYPPSSSIRTYTFLIVHF